MEKKLVSFRLPESLLEELRSKAQADGVSVTELICRFSQQGLQTSEGGGSTSTTVDTEIRLARLEERIERLTMLERRFDVFVDNALSRIMSGSVPSQFQASSQG